MTHKYEHQTVAVAWVLVADRGRAQILAADLPDAARLEIVETLVHPASTVHARDIETDGPGSFQDRGGQSHAGDPETDFRHQTAQQFAGQIVERLEKGRLTNAFGKLIVVAPPLFLGVLRDKLPAPLSQLVAHEIGKDLTRQSERELRDRLVAANAFA
ncbi:host attachment protein [Maioricimonas sp. JC845]|uniref:host attachment protein n=1 Tax=Maioricimonas sp. JC845 TaxID=3232138 RepID=UPI00345A9BE2